MSAPETVKVVLLGESGVGKTSIISQFTAGKFDPDCVTSLSATFVSKIIELPNLKKSIKYDMWDTAGQEQYRSLAKIFYKDAKVIILVYDITSSKSFNELENYWYEQIKLNVDNDVILAVVANKSDLYGEQEVESEKAQKFAEQINAIYQSTSAKSDQGISDLFDNIGQKYFNPNYDCGAADKKAQEEYQKKKAEEQQKKKEQKGVKLSSDKVKEKKQKKGCC